MKKKLKKNKSKEKYKSRVFLPIEIMPDDYWLSEDYEEEIKEIKVISNRISNHIIK